MGTIIAALVGRQVFGQVITPRGARIIGEGLLVLLILGLLGGVYACVRKDAVDDHEKKLEHRAAPATQKAEVQRQVDAERREERTKEMGNVIASVPDQPINPVSQRSGLRAAAPSREASTRLSLT
jgi:hypothetical protein